MEELIWDAAGPGRRAARPQDGATDGPAPGGDPLEGGHLAAAAGLEKGLRGSGGSPTARPDRLGAPPNNVENPGAVVGERAAWALNWPDALLGLQRGAPEADGRHGAAWANTAPQLCGTRGPAMPELGDPGPLPATRGALVKGTIGATPRNQPVKSGS
eukprot:2394019-Alexandrium_andersonii.AAC.1